MNEIKLHLGCGYKKHPEYINIDVQFNPNVDEISDIRYLRKYKTNTIDKIYSCHVLEHFNRWDYKNVLRRWYDLLKDGGRLRLAVPDFESVVDIYLKYKNIDLVGGLLYGGQDNPYNFHTWIWSFDSLKNDLHSIGFKNINRYDWKQDDFKNIDDFSKAYIPHMDFINGTLMSLNIEAFK